MPIVNGDRAVYGNIRRSTGIFQNGNMIFSILAVLASIFIIYYFPRVNKSEWTIRLAMMLQLAGAIGNLIDRIRFGFVIDFISVLNFPVFNIADSCITIGVLVLLLGIITQEIQARKASKMLSSANQENITTSE